ncbi:MULTISPECIES: filamentous haemagglutinin family protein [unclassified Janthinobacterium]|uniref:filamentous haemagglutinin family protein n=1 Tax=unclassified Janthinobacterium TaxID=2610881 RepID=UPI00088F465C|nr:MULTISPECIES: filamentous haemagglutinin family protein [unclassified Janthinobacterium]SDA78771.1 filamentous hemagglutinin family N-terminal domain-containing protein [Janthinobacterium sp. 551a]SFB62639.1 filamentous hemagglutinin family N-terminal domain-containing protein [Janthinobacterium sp. 344]
MQRSKSVTKHASSSAMAGSQSGRPVRLKPLALAIAMLLQAGGAQAQQPFSGAWFAGKGANQGAAATTGRLPNGQPAALLTNPQAQQQQAEGKLQQSLNNLLLAARGIAAEQAVQAAARQAALAAGGAPDGLVKGGLQVDTNSLTAGWLNAQGPVQTQADGKTVVKVVQTDEKAILNWESFNIGKNTTLQFDQKSNWAVLNRVNDPLARPSQIQGQIKGDGTVMIVNRNGIVFTGSSQVDTRNLAAAAMGMSDSQFKSGLYGKAQGTGAVPTFTNDLLPGQNTYTHGKAEADVVVAAGARIDTRKPQTVTEGGGYVLLAGRGVENAGTITTPNGQTTLAAGDAIVVRPGQGTDKNPYSSTRGNEVDMLRVAGSSAGSIVNSGLIQAAGGDITLSGNTLRQDGMLLSSTSVNGRGAIHLSAAGADASVTMGRGSVSAIFIDDNGATALDVQRDTLLKDAGKGTDTPLDRRDQSLVRIVSAGNVEFEGDSLTLATGGQVMVDAARRSHVARDAAIDVSGAVGVKVDMSSNNVLINVQGNEQRDAPGSRDAKYLNNSDVWVDRRDLVLVPAGTNGYATDRWYTAGGLLEVSGYLNTSGHGIGEWAAQGGTVAFGGGELVTQAGSRINIAGGSLDVQTGMVKQTWLKGADGAMVKLSTAPGDNLYTGLFRGYESTHARWGANTTETFANALIAPGERLENGYTVGRDAGRVIVSTAAAVLEGDIDTSVFQGERQQRKRDEGVDGYKQAQTSAARAGQLIVGNMTPVFDTKTGQMRDNPQAVLNKVQIGKVAGVADGQLLADALPAERRDTLRLDADWLNGLELGALKIYAYDSLSVDAGLRVADGGDIALHATDVAIKANVSARGGSIAAGDIISRHLANAGAVWVDGKLVPDNRPTGTAGVRVAPGVRLDARGVWSNLELDPGAVAGLPYVNGGKVTLKSSGGIDLTGGSVIDVSSGAALMNNGSLQGGRGGDITLAVDLPTEKAPTGAMLKLDGELRGHGVKGGGRLIIDSGTAVSVGGKLFDGDVLPAGSSAPVGLRLADEFLIAKGEKIPLDFALTTSVIKPGQALSKPVTVDVSVQKPLVLGADLLLPPGAHVVIDNKTYVWAGSTVPAGSVLTVINGLNPGFVVSAAVFPNGLPIQPVTTQYAAGSIATDDLRAPRGMLLPAGTVLGRDATVKPLLALDASLFQSGFADYAITGRDGVVVAKNAQIDVTMPVLRFNPATGRTVAGGTDPGAALELWTPELYQEDARKARLTQRAGADLSLTAGSPHVKGALVVQEGAVIQVDPGRQISMTGNAQITIDGKLAASGGKIAILPGTFGTGNEVDVPNGKGQATSIWIGDKAVLDVAGRATIATDMRGGRYGRADQGGSIEIGARYKADAASVDAADAFVVVRPGALLDASGAQATLDLPNQGTVNVAGNGGLIALSSYNGIFADGTLRAAAGGAGAAGGTLALALDTPNYGKVNRYNLQGDNVDNAVRVPREMQLAQVQGESALPDDLRAGQQDAALRYGSARLGADRVQAGGFDNLALHVNGMLSFDGDVNLSLGQSLRLSATSLGLAQQPVPDGQDKADSLASQVHLAAPYVRLGTASRVQKDDYIVPNAVKGSKNLGKGRGMLGVPLVAEDSLLQIDAGMLDIAGEVNMGTRGTIAQSSGADLVVERDAFEQLTLNSRGDMRLSNSAALYQPGNATLVAAQIYPATGDSGMVTVGQKSGIDEYGNIRVTLDPLRTLNIGRSGDGAMPNQPFSVFGTLSLVAPTINQHGVLRAPLGQINLGAEGFEANTGRVNLLPGSLTSVSATGLTMPYGGTLDGLSYLYDGNDVVFKGVGNGPEIALTGAAIDVQQGAVLDMSGGGTLTGAAFLAGRGGSTDARLTPLVQMKPNGGFTLPGLNTNPVYAIIPGVQPDVAPLTAEQGAGKPAVGRQITIAAGVPGLAAGTYTLLPSNFALLPGAFRVELNGLAGAVETGGTIAMRNGSFATAAQTGIAGTAIRDAVAQQAILTPADVLRTYSQYNETGYAAFAVAQATRDGVPRAALERDAKGVRVQLIAPSVHSVMDNHTPLMMDGSALYAPAAGGFGGSLLLGTGNHASTRYEVLADGTAPLADFNGVSVHASQINAFGAQRVGIGGLPRVTYSAFGTGSNQRANIAAINESAGGIVLRDGAVLKAAEVFLVTARKDDGIVLEQGSGINTLGRGKAAWDSRDGYVYEPMGSVLAVSNGWLDMLPAAPPSSESYGPGIIDIGACKKADGACGGSTALYSEGTIAAVTERAFTLRDNVRYGTRNLVLAMGSINVGSAASLADASARGALPDGLALNQDVLDRLLRGDTSTGAPALENLGLTARNSFNFYDASQLSTIDAATGKSSLSRLVLNTPAIYGYGGTDALARIHTDTLVWQGATNAPGAVVANGPGTGSGKLQVDARRIEFGFTPDSRPDTIHNLDRLVLGFGQVALNASEQLTANNKGSLSVYQSQSAWDTATNGYHYSGGDLLINTPLLTGAAGSVNRLTAGGAVKVSAAGGAAATPTNAALAGALGAEVALSGNSISLDTSVVLPSGKLTLSAERDVLLGDNAKLDLAGRKIDFYDTSKYSWGGDVILDSREGDVRQAAASVIDVSAVNNRAGKLSVIATGEAAGTADLRGSLLGGASGSYDAGGTQVAYAAGGLELRAQHVGDFAGLNQRLTTGKVFGSRSFQLKQGNLAIGDELKAREVSVSVDGGSLTVNGRIDASGEQVGSIRLAGRDGVTIQSGAVLDAHGTLLRTDSYGQVIEAPNRAVIELASPGGRLTLEGGARFDLRSGDKGGNYGSIDLNARRLGGATGDDIDIDAAGALNIAGARTINVNAFWQYKDAPAGTGKDADGRSYQGINQAYLDEKHADSQVFMAKALANGNLMNNKLRGLRGDANAFHLRPGVEIVSATPGGDLHIDGDIDLSGHRYDGVNPLARLSGVYGSGEAGALVLRAGGKLSVFGSITDGFDTSVLPVTIDDKGWQLVKGRLPWGGEVVVPQAGLVTLAEDTYFKSGTSVNFAVPMKAMELRSGTLLAARATLTAELNLPAGSVLGGAVRNADGSVLYAAGTVLPKALTLSSGMQLDAGLRLPGAARVAAMVWPANVALPFPEGRPWDVADSTNAVNGVVLASALALDKGSVLPAGTVVRLPGDVTMVSLRSADGSGSQGRNLALAPMLAQGSQAWSLRLVGGADTAAADTRALKPHAKDAHLMLADTHYGLDAVTSIVPGTGSPAKYIFSEAALLEGYPEGEVDIEMYFGNEETMLEYAAYLVVKVADGTPPEKVTSVEPARQPLFSVLRTGTGDLDLLAAGDFDMRSLYGVYTAGTQSASPLVDGKDLFNLPRGLNAKGQLLGALGEDFTPFVDGGSQSLYRAWYPEHGGNLLLRAQGDVKGDTLASFTQRREDAIGWLRAQQDTSDIGTWLWRQGSGSTGAGVPTAWWINFGTYVARPEGVDLFSGLPGLSGFTGIGTLGGGNLLLQAGGDAGMLASRADAGGEFAPRSQGLNVAVGSTGRVTPDGKLLLTGGGDLDIRIGGGLNPVAEVRSFDSNSDRPNPNTRFERQLPSLNSTLTNLRGALRLEAGAVGGIELRFDRADPTESRPYETYTAGTAIASGGPILVPGDSGVRIDARGDVVLGGVADAGRVKQLGYGSPFSYQGVERTGEGWSWFSLWTPATAIDLFSAGGNLTPTSSWINATPGDNHAPTDGRFVMPSVLRAVAASGSLYYGNASLGRLGGDGGKVDMPQNGVILAPSPVAPQFVRTGTGQLEMLAADSIHAAGYPITPSGADPRMLPNPFNPGFVGALDKVWFGLLPLHNVSADALAPGALKWFGTTSNGASDANQQVYPLFSMTPPTVSDYVPASQLPAHFYANSGDIVGLRTGGIVYRGNLKGVSGALGLWYEGSGPVAVRAGRDIVNSGTPLGNVESVPDGAAGWTGQPFANSPELPEKPVVFGSSSARGNLFVHRHADDVSVVSAGRDIRYSTFYVAGPGQLNVSAGRDLYMADKAELRSLGSIVHVGQDKRGDGAGISVAAGVGRNGPDYAAFAARYLDPAKLADPSKPLADQAGSAVYVYGGKLTLADWLRGQFAYSGDEAGAAAFLGTKQAELEKAGQQTGAVRRDLAREYAQVSQLHLVNWLTTRFGGDSGLGIRYDPATDARSFFAALPKEQQQVYLSNVYFAELKAAGREYNDPDGVRRGSYLRGRVAIATLFPAQDKAGKKIEYQGDLTMFSSALYTVNGYGGVFTKRPVAGVRYLSPQEWAEAGRPDYNVPYVTVNDAGIHTDFGGDIGITVPGGRALIGVDGGYAPGEGSGVLTQGQGDIQMYAKDSILLGQSRIFTTFGGNILAWSATGDINAGRGTKSTVVYTPQRRTYDSIGLVSLSPSTPTTGAGIATLNPIPEVPPGDIDLIAPLGTIDAGEAGIRVSGNVNLAALQVVNAENIQVQGKSTGMPAIVSVNVGALSNASAAASQAVTAAQDVLQRERAATRQAQPSLFTVKVLGFGNETVDEGGAGKGSDPQASLYQPAGVVQVLGAGPLTAPQLQALTPGERRGLQP